MKNLSLSLLLIPLVFSFNSIDENEAMKNEVLLFKNAINQKKVSAIITSNGGHDLNSVRVNLTNLTSSAIKITIPSGTVFIPEELRDQDLLLTEPEMIVLNPKENKNLDLNAFCIESYDSSPKENGTMSFKSLNPNSSLMMLCNHLKGKKLNSDDIQSAVWAVSDGEPMERISMNSPSAAQLRETVSDLTGQDNSWYSVNVDRRLDENRRIETSSTSISGKLKINLSAPAKVHEEVVDANGAVKFKMKTANFPKSGEWKYAFNIRVMGWKKGNYQVIVYQDGKQISAFPFTV